MHAVCWSFCLYSYQKAGHEEGLQALQQAGFDDVLQSIGEYFNMKGLAVIQLTFIGVAWSNRGWLHYDTTEVSSRSR